jgi:MYXO-CTERM domain-containing protein
MKFRNAKASIVALALAASVPALAHAQDAREPVRTEAQDNQMDFGWLGLLGLAGLFGLKRRDREQDIVRDSDRVAVNRGR